MKKTKIMDVDFKDLVEKISTDDIVLPDFPRGFVWRQKENQAALLASVLTKLPIGTILLILKVMRAKKLVCVIADQKLKKKEQVLMLC